MRRHLHCARYGSSFAEPQDNNADGSRKDIKKGILALTHFSGYEYGTNFLNVDMLVLRVGSSLN